MSTQYNVYVGPYIQVYNPEKPSTKEYHTCTKSGCCNLHRQMSEKFCPACGTKIKLVSFPSKERIEFDVYDEFDESLSEITQNFNNDYQYFISNISSINIGNRYSSDCVGDHQEFLDTKITDDIKRMSDTYKKEIAKLKEVFGDDDAVVRWGVITYNS